MKHALILFLLINMLPLVLWASPFADFMDKVMQGSQTEQELSRLTQEYLYKAQTVEEHRTLQNVWARFDREACAAHYMRLNRENPNNPDYAYLAIRLLEDKESLAGAHELATKHPKYYWGYRIIAVRAAEGLSGEEADEYLGSSEFKQDYQAVERGMKEFPEDDYLALAMAYRRRAEGSPEGALNYISGLKDPTLIQNNFGMIHEVCAQNRNREVFQRMIDLMNESAVATGSISKEDAKRYATMSILQFIVAVEGAEAVGEYISQNPDLTSDGELISFLAKLYLEIGQSGEALSYLEQAVDQGAVNYPEMFHSPEYKELQQYPRWQSILGQAKLTWERDSDARARELIAGRTSKLAPIWELKGIDGNILKLSDLRDNIVILDFWAQWCGPCKMVMPSLSTWMLEEMPSGVKVFSINVMENDYDKAKAYFVEQNFAMTYLEGDNSVASAYGVRGIPHIVIIDKLGNIAWEQVGASYDLEEKISIWVKHLGKE